MYVAGSQIWKIILLCSGIPSHCEVFLSLWCALIYGDINMRVLRATAQNLTVRKVLERAIDLTVLVSLSPCNLQMTLTLKHRQPKAQSTQCQSSDISIDCKHGGQAARLLVKHAPRSVRNLMMRSEGACNWQVHVR